METSGLRRAPAPLAGNNLEAVMRTANRPRHDRLDHTMLPDRLRELGEFGIGKGTARVAWIRLQEFDRHLPLAARSLDMRGLAADVSDQTCKTSAQSRTRFVGHRQLPWIQLERSCHFVSIAEVASANPEPPWNLAG
jgi:hypothetical protein